MVQLFGPEDARYLLRLTGKLIGMQYFDEVAQALSHARGGAREFENFLRALFEAGTVAALSQTIEEEAHRKLALLLSALAVPLPGVLR